MDLKSLVRTMRYGEMQRKRDMDPNAKQPPTIMWLGAVIVIAVAFLAAYSYWTPHAAPTASANALDTHGANDSQPPTNQTSPAPPSRPAPVREVESGPPG